jgi:predicted CXXCH cytochrome family protein
MLLARKVVLAFSLILFFPLASADKKLPMEGYTKGKHKTCVSCHRSDPVKAMFLTKHADASREGTPAAQKECESCHGPSQAHANFPLQVKNFRFGNQSPNSKKEQNAMCLECHDDEKRKEWQGGMHENAELSCTNCHTIHKESDPLLDHTKSAMVCVTCHKDKKTAQHIKGLHLIESGKVSCTDCHNPHAKLDAQLCVNCHVFDEKHLAKQSEKAQEFHAAVNKNNLSCMQCHKGVAHGLPSWVKDAQRAQKDLQK